MRRRSVASNRRETSEGIDACAGGADRGSAAGTAASLVPSRGHRSGALPTRGVASLSNRRRRAPSFARSRSMHGLLKDLRYAMRSLLRVPGFTVAAVVALGLGTGSATAIYSLLDGV